MAMLVSQRVYLGTRSCLGTVTSCHIAFNGVMESFVARSAERQTLCARVAHVIAPRLGSAGVQKARRDFFRINEGTVIKKENDKIQAFKAMTNRKEFHLGIPWLSVSQQSGTQLSDIRA